MPYREANDLELRHYNELLDSFKERGQKVRANSPQGIAFMRQFQNELDRFGYVPKSPSLLLVRIDSDPLLANPPEVCELFATIAKEQIEKIMAKRGNASTDAP